MPSDASTAGAAQDRGRKVEELERELAEAHRREAATAEVLKAISRSTFDLQGVLDALVASAARLCEADIVALRRREGDVYPRVASYGLSQEQASFGERMLPEHYSRGTLSGRAILERRTIHIPDAVVDPEFTWVENMKVLGWQTGLSVPLLRDGDLIGLVNLFRAAQRSFTPKQIELAEIFADQAVIAIENTRLFEAEQARTRELTESLEYQTAISEVLSVISHSPDQLQPVLDVITETAVRLCRATHGHVRLLREDGAYHIAAHQIPDTELLHLMRENPFRPGMDSVTGRVALQGVTVHVADVGTDPLVSGFQRRISDKVKTAMGVPLKQGGRVIGIISVWHTHVQPFTERQIKLVETFADQAVIAINNVGLFEEVQARTKEVTEALEYQTAIGEVLSVISKSPNELKPVLDAITRIASRLCDSEFAALFNVISDHCHIAAANNANATFVQYLKDNPVPVDPRSAVGRAAFERKTFHIEDVLKLPNYTRSASQKVGGQRTVLSVPLLRDRQAVGVIALMRSRVEGFTEKQIQLVETFADQAVIAIENTRLFEEVQARTGELQEALEYQTASSDVLAVISRSKFDLQPVLDTIARVARELCMAEDVVIHLREETDLRIAAHHGSIPVQLNLRRPIERDWVAGRTVVDRTPIHVPDLANLADEFPLGHQLARRRAYGTTLGIPLLREDQAIGCLLLRRNAVKPFHEKQIVVLQTFADQAVIAIENTRLFEEVQARTHELAQTVEKLEIASQHKSQFVANMSHELRTPLAAILGYAELMQEGFYEPPGKKSLDALTRIRSNGKHLLGLINTVLDIAKIESGQFNLNLGEYALENVVETVRAATEALAETKKLGLKTEVAKSLPFGVGDEQRLTQVMLNLVGNAIKFTDAGEVSITATASNDHFALSVTDTGPGIPQEHQARIFEQFHQVDSSNTKAKGGTGLGLAIAKQIVEMHGGRIWVESTLGHGATFQLRLPIRAAAHGVGA